MHRDYRHFRNGDRQLSLCRKNEGGTSRERHANSGFVPNSRDANDAAGLDSHHITKSGETLSVSKSNSYCTKKPEPTIPEFLLKLPTPRGARSITQKLEDARPRLRRKVASHAAS